MPFFEPVSSAVLTRCLIASSGVAIALPCTASAFRAMSTLGRSVSNALRRSAVFCAMRILPRTRPWLSLDWRHCLAVMAACCCSSSLSSSSVSALMNLAAGSVFSVAIFGLTSSTYDFLKTGASPSISFWQSAFAVT